MKVKFMIQSLSPLAVLIIFRNFVFVTRNIDGEKLCIHKFLYDNMVLLSVMLVCLLCIILSIFFYIQFKAYCWVDKAGGYSVKNISERKETSLDYFLTVIIPLVVDDLNTWQGVGTLAIILIFLVRLLFRTNLFFENPFLAIIGYRFYEIEFEDNEEFKDKVIVISQGKITIDNTIEYKKICDNILFAKV